MGLFNLMESDYFLQLGKVYIRFFFKKKLNGTYINHKIWQVQGNLVEILEGKYVFQKET